MPINKVQYGNQVLIDLTDSSLQSSDELIEGVTAYDRSGTKLTGTAILEDEFNIIDRTETYSEILDLYNNGKPFVIVDTNYTSFVYEKTLANNTITFNTYSINPVSSKPAKLTYSINSTTNEWAISGADSFATLSDLDSKQNTLVSGTNIKTINSNSILGSGDLSIPAGTVTSVRVQATTPVVSSTSTAQTSSLNTTISLANGYGDTKNPYASKTKNYVLAAGATADSVPSFRALVAADIPSLTKSKISDFPTSMTPTSHTHGNITNAGDITTNVAIASGDRLVINDESNSKINNSSITFGTSTTTFLSNAGTWATPANNACTFTKLWTNSSPTSAFAAQDVAIAASSYKALLISTLNSTTGVGTSGMCFELIPYQTGSVMLSNVVISPAGAGTRKVTIAASKLTFAAGSSTTNCIPYQIWGLK